MPTTSEQIMRAADEIIRRNKLTGNDKQRVLERAKQEIEARYQAKVQGIAQQEQEAQAGGGFLRRAGASGVAFGANAANTALLGGLPRVVGALSPSATAEDVQASLDAMRITNPGSSMAGSLAGFFAPSGIARGATSIAGRATTQLARTAPGIGRGLRAAEASGHFSVRATEKILENLMSGGAAIATVNLGEAATGVEGGTLRERLSTAAHRTVEQTSSPLNLALSVGFGTIGARSASKVQAETRKFLDEYKRITGRNAPPDIATDSEELAQFYSAASRMPGLANSVQRVRQRIYGALTEMAENVARRQGISARTREAAAGPAARAVEKLKGSLREPGLPTQLRRAKETAAFEAEADNLISPQIQNQLKRALGDLVAGRARTESGMDSTIRRFAKMIAPAKEGNPEQLMRLRELESLRKELSNTSWFQNRLNPLDKRFSERARVEARNFYHLIDQAIEATAPRFSRALKDGERLRRMEEALSEVEVSDIDDATAAAFWTGKKLLTRWRNAKEIETPEDVGALKAWLFRDLLSKTVSPDTGYVSTKALRRVTSQFNRYNSQVLDEVLPGVRQELMSLAKQTEKIVRGIGGPEGSQTATRQLRMAAVAAAPAALVGTIVGLFKNPFTVVSGALGTAGTAWLFRRTLQSAIEGHMADLITQRATQGLPPMTTLAPAAQSVQPLAAIGGTAQELGGLGQSALQSLRGGQQQ